VLLISHRGCLQGPDPSIENTPVAIEAAIDAGFDVEIDVWNVGGNLFLGHDGPEIQTSMSYLCRIRDRSWVHAKNIQALHLLKLSGFHVFFHDKDDCTLTSNGILWTYPGRELTTYSVAVLPERCGVEYLSQVRRCYGVCTDFVLNYKRLLCCD
jgi:hypothetical protein